MLARVYRSIDEAQVLPRLIQLTPNLFGAQFLLMKLLPARFILDCAARDGLLRPGSYVVETSSGTFGLALAMLCNLRGYRFIMVSDPVVDEQLRRRIEDLGAQVELVHQPAATGGYQRARLLRLAAIRQEHPGCFWPSQYDNPQNPCAYASVAEHLAARLGRIDCLVGTVGSGGSMCGTVASLRQLFPGMVAIGVDTHRSTLFGQTDGLRRVRGLGNSLMPANLNHATFDEIHWVDAATAFGATRQLHRRHSLFMGGTSGAAYIVAEWWARKHHGARTAVLLPDEGYRYQDTLYNDGWLRANGLLLERLPNEPRTVAYPGEASEGWTRLAWRRRTYEQVMGAPFRAEELP